jgi:hypothetical protein
MLTPKRQYSTKGFEKAKYNNLHDNIHPTPNLHEFASELVGLITRKDLATARTKRLQ